MALAGLLGGCRGSETPAGARGAPQPQPPADPLAGLEAEVERRPRDLALRLRLARELQEAGRAAAAIPHLQQAAGLRPEASIFNELAKAYIATGRREEAETVYRRLLEHAPGNAQILHNLGSLSLDRGDAERAIQYYQQAIAARPDYLIAYSNLGQVLKYHGRYDEAYAAFDRALGLPASTLPEQQARADALYQLADLDLLRGDAAGAEARLNLFLQMAPDHPKAHYTRAQALLALGREDAARRELALHMQLLDRSQPDGPAATAR